MDNLRKMKQTVLEMVDMSRDTSDAELYELIDDVILKDGKLTYYTLDEKLRGKKELFDSIRGFDILQDILEDKTVSEIMVNGPDDIFIERNGKLQRYDGKFSSKERLDELVQQIVAGVNKRVNETSPIVDARLNDGSRVNIVLKPIALNGPIITIRKFPDYSMTMEHLIKLNSITEEAALFLEKLVKSGYNIFVSGGTGSGKTTFLNVLSNYIPKTERIITIEDSAELRINGISNLVRMEMRQANTEGENEISIRELIKTSLRMRPDRIVVGEIRGGEALDMLQAMNTGHDGSLSTGHANSPKDMLSRIETMVLMGIDMPLPAIKGQIAAGIDIIVHLGRLRDNSRRVLEIDEVLDYKDDEIGLSKLYYFKENGSEINGDVRGGLIKTENELINKGKLISKGY